MPSAAPATAVTVSLSDERLARLQQPMLRAPDLTDTALHLSETVERVRSHLKLDGILSDDDILKSLQQMAGAQTPRERWLAGFESQLGQWLSLNGADLNTTLSTVLLMLPPPRS